MSFPEKSSWSTFPTAEQPSNKFKFVSCEFNMSLDHNQWSRQTYSILDWLGDCGGLFDALILLSTPFIAPFSLYAL